MQGIEQMTVGTVAFIIRFRNLRLFKFMIPNGIAAPYIYDQMTSKSEVRVQVNFLMDSHSVWTNLSSEVGRQTPSVQVSSQVNTFQFFRIVPSPSTLIENKIATNLNYEYVLKKMWFIATSDMDAVSKLPSNTTNCSTSAKGIRQNTGEVWHTGEIFTLTTLKILIITYGMSLTTAYTK